MMDESEIRFEFMRSGGPGGQNVNKVSTAVRLRFDVHRSRSLSPEVRARLLRLAGRQVTKDGVLLITAQRHRGQDQNRREAVGRFYELLRRAERAPKTRRATRPGRAADRRRLEEKKRRATAKRARRPVGWDE